MTDLTQGLDVSELLNDFSRLTEEINKTIAAVRTLKAEMDCGSTDAKREAE